MKVTQPVQLQLVLVQVGPHSSGIHLHPLESPLKLESCSHSETCTCLHAITWHHHHHHNGIIIIIIIILPQSFVMIVGSQ